MAKVMSLFLCLVLKTNRGRDHISGLYDFDSFVQKQYLSTMFLKIITVLL